MQRKNGIADEWEKSGRVRRRIRHVFSWLRSDLWRFCSFFETSLLIFLFWRKTRHEQELKQLEHVFDRSPIGAVLANLNSNLQHVNSGLCSMTRYAVDQTLDLDCKNVLQADKEESDGNLFEFGRIRAETGATRYPDKSYQREEGTKMWGRLYVCRLNGKAGAKIRLLAVVEDVTKRKVCEQKLSEAQRSLAELASRLIQVQDKERRFIASELHDDVGQRLSLLMMQLERVSRQLPTGSKERASLGRTLRELDQLTSDVHKLSHQLYSSKLQYLGLKAALRELCRQFAVQHSTEVSEMLEDVPELPPSVQLCLYRIAQEALNNVGKHSQAQQVSVQLSTTSNVVILAIVDNGIGFESDVRVEGLGIPSMRERVRTAGGSLAITSRLGQGTRLAATVPYRNGIMKVA
jgi:PAS domain S-box-containing protein